MCNLQFLVVIFCTRAHANLKGRCASSPCFRQRAQKVLPNPSYGALRLPALELSGRVALAAEMTCSACRTRLNCANRGPRIGTMCPCNPHCSAFTMAGVMVDLLINQNLRVVLDTVSAGDALFLEHVLRTVVQVGSPLLPRL